MVVFLLLFVWIPCGFISGSVASSKGCSVGSWAVAGFLFGPIALIGAAGLPDRKLRRTMRLIAEAQGIEVNEEGSKSTSSDSGAIPTSDDAVEAQRRRILGN